MESKWSILETVPDPMFTAKTTGNNVKKEEPKTGKH